MNKIYWDDFDYLVEETTLNSIENDIKANDDDSFSTQNQIVQIQTQITSMLNIISDQQVLIKALTNTLTSLRATLNNVLTHYRGMAMVTFMDDDCSQALLTGAYPIYEAKEIKASLACPIDLVDVDGYLSLAKILELKTEGYDPLNHIKGDYALSPTNTPALVSRCKQFIQDSCIVTPGTITEDIIVYPFGNIDPNPTQVANIAGEYIKYALDVGGTTNLYNNFDDLEIARLYLCQATGMGTFMEDEIKKGTGYVNKWVDHYNSTGKWIGGDMEWVYDDSNPKGWTVIFNHSWMLDADKYGDKIFVPQKLSEVIDFVKTLNCKIVTITQGLLIKYGIE